MTFTGRPLLACLLLLLSICLHRLCSGQCQTAGRFGEDCQHQCHCQQPCDPRTGICPSHCTRAYEGPTCQKQNVALGKPTKASSVHYYGTPDKAVDGDTRQVLFVGRTFFCFHSDAGRTSSFWYVDLGAVFPMNNIVIYYRTSERVRFTGAEINIANSSGVETTCTTITNPTEQRDGIFRLSCPQSGQRLIFRHVGNCGECILELCEVQVFVCSPGTYGPNCTHGCGQCRGGDKCSNVTGGCPRGCERGWAGAQCEECASGWYGQDCRLCGHCINFQACDAGTGVCPGRCQSGYTGDKCDQECAAGTYGYECSFTCAACQGGKPCDHVTGECPHDNVTKESPPDHVEKECLHDHVTAQSGISQELHEAAIQAAVDSGFRAGHSSGQRAGVGVGAGAMLGVVLLFAVVSLTMVWFWRRQRQQNDNSRRARLQGSESENRCEEVLYDPNAAILAVQE